MLLMLMMLCKELEAIGPANDVSSSKKCAAPFDNPDCMHRMQYTYRVVRRLIYLMINSMNNVVAFNLKYYLLVAFCSAGIQLVYECWLVLLFGWHT